jgi:hypothetical protein
LHLWDWLEKKKKEGLELFCANWKSWMRLDRTTLGAALDAGERSGPRFRRRLARTAAALLDGSA